MALDPEFPSDSEVDFGCEYCADGSYRWYGDVTQIATNDDRDTWLLRCPRCGALYEHTQPRGTDQTRRLADDEAEKLFPGFPR